MIRRHHGLRQYQHALQHFTWFHVDTKKLAFASIVATLAVSSGVTLLSGNKTPPPRSNPHAATPSANNTAAHPLLGIDDETTSLPGLQESTDPPQQESDQTRADPIANGVMHQTTVTINGESIEIPPSGTSHQTIRNQDGSQTNVDIQHEQAQVEGTSRSNIIIDSRSTASNPPMSLNSRITITH